MYIVCFISPRALSHLPRDPFANTADGDSVAGGTVEATIDRVRVVVALAGIHTVCEVCDIVSHGDLGHLYAGKLTKCAENTM